MESIAIVGTSGHASVVADALLRGNKYRLAGFLDKALPEPERLMGYPFLGSEIDIVELANRFGIQGVIVAVGDNALRARIVERIHSLMPGMRFASVVHPSAVVADGVQLGEGSVVFAGAVVNRGTAVGKHCILNTRSSLDHDCFLGDFASLAPGVTTGGNCRIGAHTAVGIGATIKHGVTIGEHVVVGAGSLVLNEIEPCVVAYGSPARKIRGRKLGDRYL